MIERRFAGLNHEEMQHYIVKIMFSSHNTPPTMYECAAFLDVRAIAWLLSKNYNTVEQYLEKLRELDIDVFDARKE